MTVRLENKFGSIYVMEENNDIRLMVDWSDGYAIAFDLETYRLLRHGRVKDVDDFALKANWAFQGSWSIGYIVFTDKISESQRDEVIEVVNKALKSENVTCLLQRYGGGYKFAAMGTQPRFVLSS